MIGKTLTFREHDKFDELGEEDIEDLEEFAKKVLKHKDGDLAASKYVGIITTKSGTVVEILPKIDLGSGYDADIADLNEETRRLFFNMLRCYRRLGQTLPDSSIRSMKRFPMLEIFIHRFLLDLSVLVHGGLARRYVPVEENLPCVRGRIIFTEQVRFNLVNRARFYVSYDELSVNRPANRLIHSTIAWLLPRSSSNRNRQLLRQLQVAFADVPMSVDMSEDWRKHHVDRSMLHYSPVMNWVRLLLLNEGLATFAGSHSNVSLMFPMEKVFEDFVSYVFRNLQSEFTVTQQGPERVMATPEKHIANPGDHRQFKLRPDLALRDGEKIRYILDAKWKRIEMDHQHLTYGIDEADVYQLYAYAKTYGCNTVALVYPRTEEFCRPLRFRFPHDHTTRLVCLPLNVQDPRGSVQSSLSVLKEG